MTKLVIDYPIAYTSSSFGDMTFVLAHLYQQNTEYRDRINFAKSRGRALMLDNGAYEFGSSMLPKQYNKIVTELEPTYAVIPDVYMNRLQSEKVTKDFLDLYNSELQTELMFVPQGCDADEAMASYNAMTKEYGEFFEILAIAKHIGRHMNRIKFVDLLCENCEIKPYMVHLLGFWNWKEFSYHKQYDWTLGSFDTKYPIKRAFFPKTFTSQLDYYHTSEPLNDTAVGIEVNKMYVNLEELGWT